MPPYPLTNVEIQKYQNDYKSIGTHWIALYVRKSNDAIYFCSFGVEHILRKIKKFIGSKFITTNIFRIKACASIVCGHFCIEFIDFIWKGKKLLEYTNLFSPSEYERMIKQYFKILKVKIKNIYCIVCGKYKKFKNPKISYSLDKILVLSIICSKCSNENKKIFKEEESIEIIQVLDLIINIDEYQNK